MFLSFFLLGRMSSPYFITYPRHREFLEFPFAVQMKACFLWFYFCWDNLEDVRGEWKYLPMVAKIK